MIERIAKLLRIQTPVKADEGKLWGSGASVPDAVYGWQPGAIYQDTTNGAIYVNEGTLATSDFQLMSALTAAQEALLSATAGTATASKALILDSDAKIAGSFTAPSGAHDYGFWELTVENPTGSKALRAFRVNCNPAAGATVGDTVAYHGRVTVPADATFASGAAVHAGFDWLIFGNGATFTGSGVTAAHRAIVNVGTNDYSGAGNGETAIYYGQTWATAGKIQAGLRIVAGATSTIGSILSVGGTGTIDKIIDLTEWGADTTCRLVGGGPLDAAETEQFSIWIGDSATVATVQAEQPVAAMGSLYLSTGGKLFLNTANDTWGRVLTVNGDEKLSESYTAPSGADDWGFWQLTVENPTGSKALRAFRVDCNPAASATVGDTIAYHGRVTVPADATFASGAAVHAGFDWLIFGNGATFTGSGVTAAHRAIFNVGTNDYSGAGNGETAIYYGQTWATAGKIQAGVRIVAGAGSTIGSILSVGGSGTIDKIIDLTEWDADTTCRLVGGGPMDAGETEQFSIWIGDAANAGAVQTEQPVASAGSLYISTAGYLFICTANDTWQTVTST